MKLREEVMQEADSGKRSRQNNRVFVLQVRSVKHARCPIGKDAWRAPLSRVQTLSER